MNSYKYKTGDVVQYNKHIVKDGHLFDHTYFPMLVLESRIMESEGIDWIQYLVMCGDEKVYVFEGWIELVKE